MLLGGVREPPPLTYIYIGIGSPDPFCVPIILVIFFL